MRSKKPCDGKAGVEERRRTNGACVMKDFSTSGIADTWARAVGAAQVAAIAITATLVLPAAAQSNPYSPYIPTAVPTATTTLHTGSASISPGRIGVDKAGDV